MEAATRSMIDDVVLDPQYEIADAAVFDVNLCPWDIVDLNLCPWDIVDLIECFSVVEASRE